ncbi:MAG: ATP-binding protein, partial [Pseudomonadota bacterium]
MHSLRLKLLLGAIAVQIAVVLALLLASHRAMRDVLMADVRSDARTTRLLLATALAPRIAEKDYAALREIAQEGAAVIGLAYLALFDLDGRPLATVGELPDAGVLAVGADDEPVAARGAFHVSAPIELGDQPYGRMQFGIPTERHLAGERRLLLQTIGIGGAGLVVSVLLLLPFTGVLTRGLRDLSDAAKKLSTGRYDVALPVRGADEVARLAVTFNDMSRMLSERMAALRESEARQRTLVEAIAEGVIFSDETGKVLACNDAAVRILGVPREQLLAAAAWQPHPSAARRDGAEFAPDEHPWRVALATGQAQRDVVMGVRRPDGALAWLSVNSVPLVRPGDDRPHATVTSFSDITARIETESWLQRMNAELEERVAERTRELVAALEAAEGASRAKSEFLSRMSHELRTPLNAILGFAQVLQLKTNDLPPGARDQLHAIESAGWHLLELIDEVLDLSRIESGAMTVRREPVDVAPLVTECARMADPLARKHRVRVVDRAAEARGAHALADHTRLKQVVTNLLSNAIKYNRAGGSATLTVRRGADGWVEIGVADTGRGFTEAQLALMFEPFNRLGAEDGPVDGTGIGLVITKRLVELMGGTLRVDTRAGLGSKFTVRLPAAPRGA